MKMEKAFIYIIGVILLFFLTIEIPEAIAQETTSSDEIEYTVVSGDTLSGIAKKYNVSVGDVYKSNGLKSDLIFVGQKLKIPGKAPLPAYERPPAAPEKPEVTTEEPTKPLKEEPPTVAKPSIPEEKPPVTIEEAPLASNALEFKWAFVARLDPDGRNKVVNIAKEDLTTKDNRFTMSAGDKISLFVEPGEHTYIYIYLLDSRNNLQLIYPTSMDTDVLEKEFIANRGTYIPGKFEWFIFDENKGNEVFYLVASPTKLKRLEQLTRSFLNAEGNQEITKQRILDELKGTKKTFAFKTKLERPIAFGGRLRGLEIDISKLAVEVEAENFYSKTIRIKNEG